MPHLAHLHFTWPTRLPWPGHWYLRVTMTQIRDKLIQIMVSQLEASDASCMLIPLEHHSWSQWYASDIPYAFRSSRSIGISWKLQRSAKSVDDNGCDMHGLLDIIQLLSMILSITWWLVDRNDRASHTCKCEMKRGMAKERDFCLLLILSAVDCLL